MPVGRKKDPEEQGARESKRWHQEAEVVQLAAESADVDGGLNPDSRSAEGLPQGKANQAKGPTPTHLFRQIIDFEKIMHNAGMQTDQQNRTEQNSVTSVHPYLPTVPDVPELANNFTFGEEALRLSSDELSSHVQTKPNKPNRANVLKALRLALSSLSEIIAMLKGLKTQEQNNTRQYLKQIDS